MTEMTTKITPVLGMEILGQEMVIDGIMITTTLLELRKVWIVTNE
jgi:hypothetical protein